LAEVIECTEIVKERLSDLNWQVVVEGNYIQFLARSQKKFLIFFKFQNALFYRSCGVNGDSRRKKSGVTAEFQMYAGKWLKFQNKIISG